MLPTILLSSRFSAGRAYSSLQLRDAKFIVVIVAILVFWLIPFSGGHAAPAQTAPQRAALAQQQALLKKYVEGSLMILGGNPGTTYFNVVHDMAAAVGGNGDLRLIAVDAPGGLESLQDLLFLRGIDLALVPENVLNYADAMASFGPGLRERLTYITQLYGEEVHFLAGPDIFSVENLRGQKVAVPPKMVMRSLPSVICFDVFVSRPRSSGLHRLMRSTTFGRALSPPSR